MIGSNIILYQSTQKQQNFLLWKEGLVLICILALCFSGNVGLLIVNCALLIYSIRGSKQAIQVFTILVLINFLNPGIFPQFAYAMHFKWIIILLAFARVFTDFISSQIPMPRAILFLSLFYIFLVVHSCTASNLPEMSFLKATIFFIGAATVLIAFRVTENDHQYWQDWFIVVTIVIFLIGSPLYFSAFGFWRNAQGFQGIFNHPQSYGIFLSLVASWSVGRTAFSRTKSHFFLVITVTSIVSIFASQSRTAFLTLVISSIITAFIMLIKSKAYYFTILFKNKMLVTISMITVIIYFLHPDGINKSIDAFFKKGADSEEYTTSFQLSRGAIIEQSYDNFLKNPLTGIGFGVPSDIITKATVRIYERQNFLTFPSEKGSLITGVLEEIGIFGGLMFLILLLGLITSFPKHAHPSSYLLFCSCIVINFGEVVIFSFGGMGLMMWLMLGFSLTQQVDTQ